MKLNPKELENMTPYTVVRSNSTYSTPQSSLGNLNKKTFSTLSTDQSPTATPLFLRVQEQTQSFPRIKPVQVFEFGRDIPQRFTIWSTHNYLLTIQ